MAIKVFDSELRIMKILWEQGPTPARDVAHILEDEVGWNVNTTYTTIKKLIRKKAIERREPKFECHPIITREQVQAQEARELGRKLFGGSASALLASFLSDKRISKSEIEEMKRLINEFDENSEDQAG